MTRQGASRRWSKQAQASSFGAAAAAYESGRPPYPASAVDWLVPGSDRGAAARGSDSSGADGYGAGSGSAGGGSTGGDGAAGSSSSTGSGKVRRVLDLGAGTGKLTQLLTARGLEVTAVEPLAEMREQLAAAVPGAKVLDGSAEKIPLADGSVDAVVVAQAWHWFEPSLAIAEVARVLTPGGTLGLVWNIRDHTEPWVAELDRVLHRHSRQEINTSPELSAPFEKVERLEVRWEHALTRSELLDMVASRSYVITMPANDRAELLNQVGELLDSHLDLRGRKNLTMPYITRCTRAELPR
jgi:SAM-dependent methyltransferase